MATAETFADCLFTGTTQAAPAIEIPKKSAIADRVADLLARPNEVRFKDFENPDHSHVWAAQDYCNVFAPFTLVAGGFGLELSMPILKSVRRLGVPGIAEYFCTKAVAGGITMDQEGVDAWSDLPILMKTKLSGIFHGRCLSGFDWRQMSIIDLVEQDAYLLDSLLKGEWPDESDKKACRHYIEILGTVAAQATRRMHILNNPKLMEEEIERSIKP